MGAPPSRPLRLVPPESPPGLRAATGSTPRAPQRLHARYPQPRRHATLGGGMTVSVGRVQDCPVLGVKFVVLSHNTIRGAAGGAILNAELMHAEGLLARHRTAAAAA